MAVWTIEVRTPGAGGAWTAISTGRFINLAFRKDLNQLQWLDVDLWGLSAAEEALVVQGNDIRALAGAAERWYGQIQDADQDPQRRKWKVHALGKGILAFNRAWASRREWVNLPPEVIVDEVIGNVIDEELRAGLQVLYDMETLDGALMDNLATATGAAADGTITGTISVVAKWGLGRDFTAETDRIVITGYNYDGFTAFGHGAHVRIGNAFATRTLQTIYGTHTSTGTAQGTIRLSGPAGGLPNTIGVLINTATQGFQTISRSFTFVLGTVYHIYATWDGSNVRVYVDGVQQGAAAAASGALVNGAASHVVGHRASGDTTTFHDFIDNVTSYNRAPSQPQVLALAGRSIYEGGLSADAFDPISFRAEEDTRLFIADGVAKDVGAEWFADRDASDFDRFRFVTRRGSATPTDTFQFGQTILDADRQVDRTPIVNDIIALGFGDSVNQLRSRIWHATTIRNTLAERRPGGFGGPTDGLVLHWDHETLTSGGLMRDLSPNANDGTISGPADIATGKFKRARDFDGADDTIHVASPTFIDDQQGAVSCWVNFDRLTAVEDVWTVSVDGSTDDDYIFEFRGDLAGDPFRIIRVLNGTQVVTLDSPTGLVTDTTTFHHFVVQANGTEIELYVDGVKRTLTVVIGSNDGSWLGDATDADVFTVGALRRATVLDDFDGIIDEVRVFDRILTVAEIRQLAGFVRLDSSAGFPANGVVQAGAERIRYASVSGNDLLVADDGFEYVADGYPSEPTYDHSEGIAVWLHGDTTTTPDTYYDPSDPQTGSSIQVNGHRQGPPFVDRGIIDQDTLDFLAQRLLDSYRNPRESLVLYVRESDIPADVGDDVTVLTRAGGAYENSPYRIHALQCAQRTFGGGRPTPLWTLELGAPRDVREAELARLREEMRLSRSYGQGSVTGYVVPGEENIEGGQKAMLMDLTISDLARAVNRVTIERLRLRPFEKYTGGASTLASSTLAQVQEVNSGSAFSASPAAGVWTDLTGDVVLTVAAEYAFAHCSIRRNDTGLSADIEFRVRNVTTGALFPSATGIAMTAVLNSTDNTFRQAEFFLKFKTDGTETFRLQGRTSVATTLVSQMSLVSYEDDMPHSHDPDIVDEAYISPSVSIRIDGVDRTTALGGPFTADTSDIEIGEFITEPGTYTIEFSEGAAGKVGRIHASIYVEIFLRGSRPA